MSRVLSIGLILYSFIIIPMASYAGEYDDLEQLGFRVVEDSDVKLHFKIHGKEDLIISKKRFANSLDANQFCQAHSVPQNGLFSALMLAMSGAADGHKFLEEAIVFDFSEWTNSRYSSGIWAWSGTGRDNVAMMFDGHGMDVKEKSLSAINAKYHTDFTLPALCSNFDMERTIAFGR